MQETVLKVLRSGWGFDSFRPLQGEAVHAAIAGRDALVVLPTGGGKSICYQLPAALKRGLVIVVSPLIALMDDQIASARDAGLVADALHSNLEPAQKAAAYRRLSEGTTEILYVSPERLIVGDLADSFGGRVILVAVDEAHCVSHWGHEFRPEYRKLAGMLNRFPKASRMALTATATPEVRNDIVSGLGLRDPLLFVGHPDRPNLTYRAFPRHDQTKQVLDVVLRHQGDGVIVYAQTRKVVDRLTLGLKKAGFSCESYHAGLSAEHRKKTQSDFVNERLDVVVATIAFGMGIDRSNVRCVVHANSPRSIEHYQQESGRAGRDGLPGECVLLFSASDLAIHRGLSIKEAGLSPERKKVLEKQLREMGRYAVAPVCRHKLLSEHFGAEYPPPDADREGDGCGACDVCLTETKPLPVNEAVDIAKKVLSAAWRTGGRFGAGYVVRLLAGRSDERMDRYGHSSLKVFGLLKEHGETAIRSWIDQLVVQGFLEITEESEYPLLRITPEGIALCHGDGNVNLGFPAKSPKKSAPKTAKKASSIGKDSDADDALFERLRSLRRLIAERLHLPPYVVFHDTALMGMASAMPDTLEALSDVKGVGEAKLKRYGPAFLNVIAGGLPEKAAEGIEG